MKLARAFDLTLKQFSLRASDIAEISGVPDTDISRFRNGKRDIGVEKFTKLVDALPAGAKDFLWLLYKLEDEEIYSFRVSA
jgi:transcriptional regulator with XRE-family HTH domain